MGVETGASGKVFPGFGAIGEDLVPDSDATRDIGEAATRWNYIYAVIAVLTSMVIGGIYLTSTSGGWFLINASTQVNGSLNVIGNVTADYYFGDGSGLTGVTADINITNIAYYNQSVNWSGYINASGYYIYASYFVGDGSRLTNLSFLLNTTFTQDQIDAITNSQNPNATNYFATIYDLTSGNLTINTVLVVRNDEGAQLNVGDPVTFTTWNVGLNLTNVERSI